MKGETAVLTRADLRLTKREHEIIDLLLRGQSNKEIASQLGVSDQTIKNQLTTLYRKMDVSSRLELVVKAVNQRINRA
jgi:two-component system, NarL family, nitrate/nitrite response regulator NarL